MGVLRVNLALLASTTTLGAMLFLAAWSPTLFGVPLFGLAGLVLGAIGAGLFGALGVHVLFAALLDPRTWWRRLVGFFRFFSWRRRKDD